MGAIPGYLTTGRRTANPLACVTRWLSVACGVVCLVALAGVGQARAASADLPAAPAACKSLQAKFPGLKGKTLVDALNPHTPGYEALDPQDPSHRIRASISGSMSIWRRNSAPASASS